jgi:hypothetical protein
MFRLDLRTRRVLILSIWLSLALLRIAAPALAHGGVEVGEYELVIGFLHEPAYAGEPNGLDLRVAHHETGEPVAGLEDTLHAEIIFGSHSRELDLRPQFGQAGAYTADVLPTVPGDYTFRVWGEIDGTPVDVEMTSGPDTFGSVEEKSVVAFPSAERSPAELEAQARTALIVGGVGAALGAASLALSLAALRRSPRA